MFVKQVLNQVFTKRTDAKDAIKILAQGLSRDQLSEFIVDAFQRGWIDRQAMGLPMPEATPLNSTAEALKASDDIPMNFE
jgi:hypothetical protein